MIKNLPNKVNGQIFIKEPGNYGDVSLVGLNPELKQDDNPLRIRSKGEVILGKVKARDCGMPIRHEYVDETSKLFIYELDAARFTADLFNSFGELEIVNLIVVIDGSQFTWEDYEKLHVDALGQLFNYNTGIVQNVRVHNIYARIKGKLIKGLAVTENHLCRNVQFGTGKVDIRIEYKYAALMNTAEKCFINVGDNGVRIKDVKRSKYISNNVEIVKHSTSQLIVTDFKPYIINQVKPMNTKIALIIGHNPTSQGAVRKGITEFMYWSEFFDQYYPTLKEVATKNGIEIKVFERRYFGRRTYGKEMRDLHSRVDAWDADISVECHYNGFSGDAEGHEVLYFNESKGGRIIAGLIDNAMDKHLNNRDRDRKPVSMGENGSYGLRIGAARAVLIEPFFGQEIINFIKDGSQRVNLLNVFKDFFVLVNKLNKESDDVTQTPNRDLTDEEYLAARELIL